MLLERLAQYVAILIEMIKPTRVCEAVRRVLYEGFGLPCFASPSGAFETICLFLKTFAV